MRQFIEQKSSNLKGRFRAFYYQDYSYYVSPQDLTQKDFDTCSDFGKELKRLLEGEIINIVSETYGVDTSYYLLINPEAEYFLVMPYSFPWRQHAEAFATQLNQFLEAHGFGIRVETKEVKYDREWEYMGRHDYVIAYPHHKYFFEIKAKE